MTLPALVGIDWGSTRLRVHLVAGDGTRLESRASAPEAKTGAQHLIDRGGRPADFEAVLAHLAGDWLDLALPRLMCGAVGSERGWRAAPYVGCPAGLAEVAAALTRVKTSVYGEIGLVPGCNAGFTDGEPEMMRGEETQVLGLLGGDAAPPELVILPGTHSKWVSLASGRITGLRTYLTGELRAHILGAGCLVPPPEVNQIGDAAALREGAALAAGSGALSRLLYAGRARRLAGRLPAEHVAAFLSGVLIGQELEDEAATLTGTARVALVASGAAAETYGTLLADRGVRPERHDPDEVTARGLFAIARAAGWIGGT